jgi:hypothetical protein
MSECQLIYVLTNTNSIDSSRWSASWPKHTFLHNLRPNKLVWYECSAETTLQEIFKLIEHETCGCLSVLLTNSTEYCAVIWFSLNKIISLEAWGGILTYGSILPIFPFLGCKPKIFPYLAPFLFCSKFQENVITRPVYPSNGEGKKELRQARTSGLKNMRRSRTSDPEQLYKLAYSIANLSY